MQGVKELQQELSNLLNWHGSRLDFLAKFILSLIKVRTVNLAEIATAFPGPAKVESHYKRLQRFFRGFELNSSTIAELVSSLIPGKAPWILTLDRTNWKFGQVNINLLVLGIAHKGIAFPILWSILPKAGNSNTEERLAILERFVSIFGKEKIAFLLADREFIGKQWFDFLNRENIQFRIRIKKKTLIYNSRGTLVHAWTLFNNLKLHEIRIISKPREIWGLKLYIAGTKLPDGDFLILVSSNSPSTVLTDYAKRWEIETLFGCLKSRGFRFEQTHLTEADRISKLVALLTIAFTWSYLTGEWLCQNQENIPWKKTIKRPVKSIFRHGLDHLRHIILNLSEKMDNFISLTKLLSCT